MGDDAVSGRAERAGHHGEARRRRTEQETAKAQALVDDFVAQATQRGLPTEQLTARPWSGNHRYRTGVDGWYVRGDRSLGVGPDGSYYVLLVAPVRFGRWRTVPVTPSPPPLLVGEGGRDGEAVPLETLLRMRLDGTDPTPG